MHCRDQIPERKKEGRRRRKRCQSDENIHCRQLKQQRCLREEYFALEMGTAAAQ